MDVRHVSMPGKKPGKNRHTHTHTHSYHKPVKILAENNPQVVTLAHHDQQHIKHIPVSTNDTPCLFSSSRS